MTHSIEAVAGIIATPPHQVDREFKADLVTRGLAPDAPVLAVAVVGDINAKLLFK